MNYGPVFWNASYFPSLTHLFDCDLFLQVWPSFESALTYFFKYDPFFLVWGICSCIPFYQVWDLFWAWPNFSSVTHFFKCELFVYVWQRFSGVKHEAFFNCDLCLLVQAIFFKIMASCPIFRVWHISTSVTYYFEVWPRFLKVFKCDSFFQV